VVADDDRDNKRGGRVEPVPAASGQNDRAADRDACGGGRVGGSVEQHRLDVQVFAAVIVIGVTAKDERPGQHDDSGDRADDQHGQPLDAMGPGGQVPGRRHRDHDVQDQQPSGVDQSGGGRRVGVAVRTGGQPDRQQRHADGRSVREIVSARREDSQRMRGQTHDHERRDEAKIKH
jgi:hypothetical protein